MKMLAFAILDTKSQAYCKPWFSLTIPEALRTFTDAVNTPESPYYRHPADYLIYHVGSYDDSSGLLEPCQLVPLGSASNFHRDAIGTHIETDLGE